MSSRSQLRKRRSKSSRPKGRLGDAVASSAAGEMGALPNHQPAVRRRWKLERCFLVAAFAMVASIVVGQIWGTSFTCEDDLFTATATQSWGGGAQGWAAVGNASWAVAVSTGRFYQLVAFSLTQVPYHLGSFDTVNVFRICTMLFVFATYAAMLSSLTRSFLFAILCSILAAGLMETKYSYNPFHAYPMWFNLGLGVLFLSVLVFQEAMVRGRPHWLSGAAVGYFCTLLFYEAFILYGLVFFVLAYFHSATRQKSIAVTAGRAFVVIWPFSAAAVLYGMLYVSFKHLHPGNYPGTVLSLASFPEVTGTIIGFSLSGLNLRPILTGHTWSAPSATAASLVLAAAFWALWRLSRNGAPKRLSAVAGLSLVCMVLPNILYGFTERYRDWLVHYGRFYLGSFYSGFAEAVVIASISLWIVRQGARFQLAAVLAAGLALVMATATYSNVSKSEAFFRVHRDNRRVWNLVDAAIVATGGLGTATVLQAPGLNRMKQLSPGIYHYWDYYLSRKLRRQVHVISGRSDFSKLAPKDKSGPVFAFSCQYFPDLNAGLFAFGPLDASVPRDDGRLLVRHVQVGVIPGGPKVFERDTAEHPEKLLSAGRQLTTIDRQQVDLNELILRP